MTTIRPLESVDEASVTTPIGTLLSHQANRDPDRPQITIDGVSISRRAFEERANRRARAFAELGVRENDLVAIALPTSLEFHESAFAAWKLGATPAPLSHRLPDPELTAILGLMDPRLTIGVSPALAAGAQALPSGFVPDPRLEATPLPERAAKHWKAITSGGSTGRPKVIVDNRPAMLESRSTNLGLKLDDTLFSAAPLYHNAPFSFTHMAMAWGSHVVETSKFDPVETLASIERYGVEWLYLVPTMMKRIWSLPADVRQAYDLSSLEIVLHMASSCPVWLKENWIDWLGPEKIWEIYAGSEGIGGASINGCEWLDHKGSVGRPLARAELRIFTDAGEEAPAGEVGEVYFRLKGGANSRYHYRGAEAKRIGDWETYGDLGSLDKDGYLYLSDRRVDMVVSGGANIYPAEVEAVLDEHPDIASSIVVGLPDPDLGQRLHAILQYDDRRFDPQDDAFQDFLAARLVRYKLPYTFDRVEGSLRDDAGKARRSSLREERVGWLDQGRRFEPLRRVQAAKD